LLGAIAYFQDEVETDTRHGLLVPPRGLVELAGFLPRARQAGMSDCRKS
jgi:hypothetical protein